MENNDDVNIYRCKDGRMRVYIKGSQKVISYPKYVMEKYLGRKLKDNEQVHHKDGNPLNNDIDNLEVLTFEEHLNVHADENRKYYDKIMVCPWCSYGLQNNNLTSTETRIKIVQQNRSVLKVVLGSMEEKFN